MDMMPYILQILIAFGLLNVWIVRANLQTRFRGGDALTIRQEFANYGLPDWACYVVGALKITCAILLLVGLWVPQLVLPAASLVSVLMVGAIAMHFKIKDSLIKSVPALIMLFLCLSVCVISLYH